MSLVILKNSVSPSERPDKKILQACEVGGSIYGRKTDTARSGLKSSPAAPNGIAEQYKNFYRNQVDALSKVFEKNMKQG